MITYRFRATRVTGGIESGFVEVSSRREATEYLAARGLLPIVLEPGTDARRPRRRIGVADVAIGLRTLATLLASGLTVPKALAAFHEVAPPAWQNPIRIIRERARAGEGLARAIERSGMAIDEVVTGMLAASEAGGGSGLAQACARAATLMEQKAQFRAAIVSALAYPALLATVGSLSLGVIVTLVLPRFSQVIVDAGAVMPPLARGVIAAGDAARLVLPLVVVVSVLGILSWRYSIADNKDTRRRASEWLTRSPVLGPLRLATASSRVCMALGALIRSGVPVPQALALSARTAGNAAVASSVLAAREEVLGGARLSDALFRHVCVTATARRLIRAGEESGSLADMLDRSSEMDADYVRRRLAHLVRFIEPALILMFAGVVALVATALLQAVYAFRP